MIKIICVGKLKEAYFRDAVTEYQKRLSKYAKVELIEVADEKTDDAHVALTKEKDRILSLLSDKDYVITLEIEGKSYDSVTFASFLEEAEMRHGTLAFVIGGSCGLHSSIKERANVALSFSSFTFPHQLFRVMLLEQIYRAYKIRNHEAYHK